MKNFSSLYFIAILTAAVTCFFLFLYRPVDREIKQLRVEIYKNQNRSLEEKLITEVLREKTATVEKLRQEVTRLRAGLLPSHEYSPLMKDLRNLLKKFSFEHESTFLKGDETRDRFDVAVLEVRLKGRFQQIYEFILGLENLQYAVQIDQLQLRGDGRNENWIDAQMTLSAPRDTLEEDMKL